MSGDRAMQPLAIRYVGTVCAAGLGLDALWRAVCESEPLAEVVARYDVSDLAVRRAALVSDALWQRFERRWPGRERSVQLALAAVEEALGGEALPADTALYVGTSLGAIGQWERWHRALTLGERDVPAPQYNGHSDTALALARELSLRGPVTTVSTACTSSAMALSQAADALRLGAIDRALVVGVDVLNRFVHAGFDRLCALAPDSAAPAPFALDRGGMWLGEGAAAMVLTREEGGVARFLGSASAGDGVHMTAPDRTGSGLARAIIAALSQSGASRDDVAWVSVHGTSTRFNDAMEAAALARVFASCPPCHAAKPVIGHTLGASGLLEAALCIEALRRRQRPRTFTRDPRDPALEWVALDREEAAMGDGVALSLSAAMAGHNAAIVLGAAR